MTVFLDSGTVSQVGSMRQIGQDNSPLCSYTRGADVSVWGRRSPGRAVQRADTNGGMLALMLPAWTELHGRLDTSDQPEIEAKASSHMGESVLKAVCAFANAPGAGAGTDQADFMRPQGPAAEAADG